MSERRDADSFFGGDEFMGQHAREAGPLLKTHDQRYGFRGIWDKAPEGVCRVRILEAEGTPPTMILTELTENPSTSVTNVVEILAAELIARHFPQRFEAVGEDPILLIEHYEVPTRRRGFQLGASRPATPRDGAK